MLNQYDYINTKIIQWANDRNLIQGSDSFRQFNKLEEESEELLLGLMRDDLPEIADALGDMYVVMTVIAEMHGLDMMNCIEGAYDTIKHRKGKMQNGFFVKEAV